MRRRQDPPLHKLDTCLPCKPYRRQLPPLVTTAAAYKAAMHPGSPKAFHASSSMADSPPLAEIEIKSEGHERRGLSTPQILALLTLLPTGGTLLLLACVIFAVTMVGLTVAVPLTVIFSPVLVPAVIGVALAVSGFVASETLVATGVSALSCAWESLQRVWRPSPPPLKDMVDRLVRDNAQNDGPVVVQFEP